MKVFLAWGKDTSDMIFITTANIQDAHRRAQEDFGQSATTVLANKAQEKAFYAKYRRTERHKRGIAK